MSTVFNREQLRYFAEPYALVYTYRITNISGVALGDNMFDLATYKMRDMYASLI